MSPADRTEPIDPSAAIAVEFALLAYALEDLDRWAEQGMHRSTCDPGTDTGHPAKRITPGREAR